jgi:hypothetical protein
VGIYIHIITDAHSQSAKTLAASNLADELERLFFARQALIAPRFDFLKKWVASTLPLEQSDRYRVWNRDMVNACTRLQGCLLALQLSSLDQVDFVPNFQKWAQNLRFVIREETVCLKKKKVFLHSGMII